MGGINLGGLIETDSWDSVIVSIGLGQADVASPWARNPGLIIISPLRGSIHH